MVCEEMGRYKEYYQECDFGDHIRESIKYQSHYNDGFNIIVPQLSEKEILYLQSRGYSDILDYHLINFWT